MSALSSRLACAAVLLGLVLATTAPAAARASDAPAPAATATSPASARTDGAPRVRATHKVDVIGPGERVETVIDRLRAARPARDGTAGPHGDRPARPGDFRGAPGEARPPMDDGHAPPGGMGPLSPPPGGTRSDHTGGAPGGDRPHR